MAHQLWCRSAIFFPMIMMSFPRLLTIVFAGAYEKSDIPVIFQVASLLAALTHPGHRVIYAPGDSLPCRRNAS
ncbi:hypothetical protein [Photorhabdus cinerea]|uniref:Uncharacterized protein n=1 Tax=Photorhabdus cinerea TaxID=471575 RepID=A0A7X5QHR4_9GAMM|nr:hypothetical protein [Photorhabdus cinerea]NHB94380.1 hypothetical protein [Photorhabdus cinerea]